MIYISLFDSGPSHSYTCILSCGGKPSVFPLSRASILPHIQMTVSSANICRPVYHHSKLEGAQSRSSSNFTHNTPPQLSYMSGTTGTFSPATSHQLPPCSSSSLMSTSPFPGPHWSPVSLFGLSHVPHSSTLMINIPSISHSTTATCQCISISILNHHELAVLSPCILCLRKVFTALCFFHIC